MEKKRQSKVIVFPGADEEIVEQANKAIDSGDFDEANRLFERAFQHQTGDQMKTVGTNKNSHEASIDYETQLLTATDSEKLYWIYELSRANIRAYLDVVKSFLVADNHPLLKSLLISALIDQEVDEPIHISKFDTFVELIPSKTARVEDSQFAKVMEAYFRKTIANENPSLHEQALAFIHDQNLLLFPLQMDGLDQWARAYHFYLNELFGLPNHVEMTELVAEKLKFIKKLDQFSPINL